MNATALKPLPLPLLDWCRERLDTCQRVAREKKGSDRAGWHEDIRYWELVIGCLERSDAVIRGLRRGHLECEDCWYSCPKSEGGCCNEDLPKDKCTCGADEHNALIDAALSSTHSTTGE